MMNQGKSTFNFSEFDYLTIQTDQEKYILPRGSQKVADVCIEFENNGSFETLFLTAQTSAVLWIKLRWNRPLPRQVKILGDAWERGYGDLQWRGMNGSRFMPWYFLASDERQNRQWGFGVRVRPSAMCYWQVDTRGITLVLDVRSGGEGVLLSGRRLKAAELLCLEGEKELPFHFAQAFCRMMCKDPILLETPVYGGNNWYYAYGSSSQEEILADANYLLELTKGAQNSPFMVIDDCWQEHHRLGEYNGGPWRKGNDRFPDMKGLAGELVQMGVRPGIWVRLLQNEDEAIPEEWRLPTNSCLDPSHPGALEYIRQDVRRICGWGYQLIKHDFSTYDLFGRWGMEMNPLVTGKGWHFYDRSRTSAQVVKELYQAIYDEAKKAGALIIGCNTIGHLGAGLMHISRTGDDTSGFTWERTRRMGVNTLAFRLPQHKTFFDVDADCVGITGKIPWELNRQWADVIAESGTPLFVSAKPGILNPQQKEELKKIMIKASRQECHKIPEDWQQTAYPEIWTDGQERVEYNWYEESGPDLEGNEERYYAMIPLS